MQFNHSRNRHTLYRYTGATLLSTLFLQSAVFAETTEKQDADTKYVTVTGSRISK